MALVEKKTRRKKIEKAKAEKREGSARDRTGDLLRVKQM